MKIANEKTFEEFDRLKDQLFAHKRSTTPKPKPPNPFKLKSFPLKTIMGLTLSLGGIWLLAKNTNNIKQYLIQSNHITYQQSIAYAVLHTHLVCKWKELMTWQELDKNKYLANNLYAVKMQSDLVYLTKTRPKKKLYIQTRSRFSIWILGWNNQEVVRYINAYGDLVQKNTTSKLMLGDLMRIWTKQSQRLVKREKVFAYYEKQQERIGKECEKVNYLARLQYSKEEYEQVIAECHRKIGVISRKISEVLKMRQAQEKKQYKQA